MASVAQLLGRRPTKFSFGQGVGLAIQEGGKVFGELAIQKRNAEALAEARGYDEKVQAARDAREDSIRSDEIARQEAMVADERAYQDGVRQDTRQYNEGLIDEERAHAASLLGDARRYNEEQNAEALAQGALTESRVAEDGVVHKYRLDTNGNVVKDLGPDPDFGVDANGNVVRASAGGQIRGPQRVTVEQGRLQMLQKNVDRGAAGMAKMLGEGYDLRSGDALLSQVAGSLGSYGNWVNSPEGRQFQTHQRMAAESIQKAMSGAAGSEAEAATYRSFMPSAGDDPQTAAVKLDLLNFMVGTMKTAAADYSTEPGLLAEFLASEYQGRAADIGFDVVTGTAIGASSPAGGPRLSAEDADLFQRYGLNPQ